MVVTSDRRAGWPAFDPSARRVGSAATEDCLLDPTVRGTVMQRDQVPGCCLCGSRPTWHRPRSVSCIASSRASSRPLYPTAESSPHPCAATRLPKVATVRVEPLTLAVVQGLIEVPKRYQVREAAGGPTINSAGGSACGPVAFDPSLSAIRTTCKPTSDHVFRVRHSAEHASRRPASSTPRPTAACTVDAIMSAGSG